MNNFDDGEVVYNEPPFRQIPDSLVFHDDIADMDVRLFHVLVWCARGGRGAFPGRKKLAEMLKKKSPRTIDAALDRLRETGYLTIKARYNDKGARISNLYMLHHSPLPPGRRQTRPAKDQLKLDDIEPATPVATDCNGGREAMAAGCDGAIAADCEDPSQQAAHIRDTKEKRHQEEERSSLPAEGDLQHRKDDSPSDLRPGNEDHSTQAGSETTGTRSAAPQSPLATVWQAMPAELRKRISGSAQGKVLDAIRAELAHSTRTPAHLVERIGRRWGRWQAQGEQVGNPVMLAITLVQRRHCPDVQCEDGVRLDDGQACQACTPRLAAGTASAPTPRVLGVEPVRKRYVNDDVVADVLAPVTYVAKPENIPAPKPLHSRAPRRSEPTEIPAVQEARAQLAEIARRSRYKAAQASSAPPTAPADGAVPNAATVGANA